MKRISALVVVGLSVLLGACATTAERDYTKGWTRSAPEFLQLGNGATVRYVQSGEAPPLVLLHTIRTQLDYFEKLVPELNGHYRVFALDLPGHGHSSPHKNWTIWLDAHQRYSKVKAPVTFIYGRDDWSRQPERERNRDAIPGSELVTIEQAGHFMSLEKRAEVAGHILSRRAN